MLCDRLLAQQVPFVAGPSNSPPRERLPTFPLTALWNIHYLDMRSHFDLKTASGILMSDNWLRLSICVVGKCLVLL